MRFAQQAGRAAAAAATRGATFQSADQPRPVPAAPAPTSSARPPSPWWPPASPAAAWCRSPTPSGEPGSSSLARGACASGAARARVNPPPAPPPYCYPLTPPPPPAPPLHTVSPSPSLSLSTPTAPAPSPTGTSWPPSRRRSTSAPVRGSRLFGGEGAVLLWLWTGARVMQPNRLPTASHPPPPPPPRDDRQEPGPHARRQ